MFFAAHMSADNFTNKFKTQQLNFNKDIDTTVVVDLNIPAKITSLSISGTCKLSDYHRALFRVVLTDKTGHEYLVAEYIGYLEAKKTINFKNQCIETILLDGIQADKLKVIISQARGHINSIEYSTDNDLTVKQQAKLAKKMQHKNLADKYNDHNKAQQMIWLSDTLCNTANLSYMEKKSMFGNNSDYFMTDGIEYYSGGFFVVSDSETPLSSKIGINISPRYIPNFTWSNKHGRNWNTPVKSQVKPTNNNGNGGCWAFAAVAVAESFANLYYNQKIDLDLSEQQVISCSHGGTNAYGGSPTVAAIYIVQNGLVDDTCFPFSNSDEPCDNQCANPYQFFMPEKFSRNIPLTEDSIKHNLIHHGPLLASINNNFYNHAMSLVGYGKITESTTVSYYYDGQPSTTVTVPANSPLIGRTYWIFKNSYGTTLNNDGYLYAVFDDFSMLSSVSGYYSGVHSITGYSDADIKCEDLDGDGYYNWGIGPKPAHCPNCPDKRDADDFNPYIGGMDDYGYGVDLYNNNPGSIFLNPILIGPDTITCDGTYRLFNLNSNYTNIAWQIVNNTMPSFMGYKLHHTTTQGCPMATFIQGKSFTTNLPYVGNATIKVSMYNSSTQQTKVIEKEVYVVGSNTPYVDTTLNSMANKDDTRTFKALNCDQIFANNIAWTITTPSHSVKNYRGRSVSYKFTEAGTYSFEVKNLASCDPDNLFTFSVSVTDYEAVAMSYNNPVHNELNISIKDNDKQNDDQYTIEIWHDQFGKMKSITSASEHIDINTEQLSLGYYTIKLYKNNECIQASRVLIE